MKIVTADQMRELDRRAIEEFGAPGHVLMDRAGRGVAEAVRYLARMAGLVAPPVHVIAGRGNNGGDGFVAARYLKEAGFRVDVRLAGTAADVRGDALAHLDRMRTAGVELSEWRDEAEWEKAPPLLAGSIMVDGVLGTGASGRPRGPAAGAVAFMNRSSDRSLVVAIDIPSGLNADTGKAGGEAVRADLTVTLGLPKCGLIEAAALEFVGALEVVDIGIPSALVDAIESEVEFIAADDLRPLLRRRARNAHKGDFGRILVIGGSVGYSGAAAMAARAAVRTGAGLVTVLAPSGVASAIAGFVPEAMVYPAPESAAGFLCAQSLARWERGINDFDVALIGPGLTAREETRELVDRVLRESRVPVVVDADALNVCAGRVVMLKRPCPIVITPHPGEMARLLGCKPAQVQADRTAAAIRAAETMGVVTVLKGAGTIVALKDRPPQINLTGNPGMASGGMGDVLGGMIAALAGQGLNVFDAARMAVFLHGHAGDCVAWRTSQAGLCATDVIEALPQAIRHLTPR